MPEKSLGCAHPTGSVVGEESKPAGGTLAHGPETSQTPAIYARVGGKAPDFEAPAYRQGSFTTIKLSQYLGKWVLLCFYPGDFTFV